MTGCNRASSPLKRVALWGAALAVVSCGVPQDEAATVVDPSLVPFDLLDSTTTTVPPSDEGQDAVVCLTLDGLLRPVGRNRDGSGNLDTLLELVTSAPTRAESRQGLRSLVDEEDAVLAVRTTGEVARVDLGDQVAQLSADQQLLAVAQVTCTLTTQPDIDGVIFRLDGERIDVPIQGGALVDRPVTREDYAGLLPT